ncbi:hypothetical protein DYB32_008867 [Aphanomyces invadans]|uniref:Spindle pole body component n=1 Tax=Aphanomyces invadans TaxID=157072 RepID=A0A418AJX2_9STRA|nr:hypothetical protein DYB32_008867 [Aphanomyces invadans]
MLRPVLHVGYCYRRLSRFAQLPPFQDKSDGDGSEYIRSSLYLHSFRESLSTSLAAYEQHVADLERDVLAKTSQNTSNLFPFTRLLVDLHGEIELFPFLCRLVDQIERKNLRGKGILELLQSHDHCGYPRIQACVRVYLCNAHRVLYRQMMSWMTAAQVVDPFGEFFITQSSPTEYTVDLGRVPLRYFPSAIAEDVLFVGNAMKIVGASSSHHKEICNCLHELASRGTWATHVVQDSLARLRGIVATALGTRVVVQGQFVRWLKLVKSFYLLGEGDLFHAVVERASVDVFSKGPPTSRSEQDLNHGIWATSLREFQFDSVGSISLRVPLQEFSYTFQRVGEPENMSAAVVPPGLVVHGVRSADARGLATSESWLTCWFHHIQYISRSFRSSFSVDMPSAPTELSLVLQSNGVHVVPEWTRSDRPRGGLPMTSASLRLQCQFHTFQDSSCRLTTRLYIISTDASQLVHEATATLPFASDATFHVEYSADVGGEKNVPVTTAGWRVQVNGSICFEHTPMNVLKHVDGLARQQGGMFVGLVLQPGVTVLSWSCDKRPPQGESDDPWAYVSLDMDIPWPLPLLLTPPTLTTYSHVFQLLFRLKRVIFALNTAWKHQSSRSTKTCVLRHHLAFALSNVFLYFQMGVIDADFDQCVAECDNRSDFDLVKRAHDAFVADVAKKCYVYSSTVMNALNHIVALGWEFTRTVDDPRMDSALLEAEFATTMQHFGAVLANTDARALVLLLDFNGYFSRSSIEPY